MAAVMLAAVGAGNALIDVGGFTLIARNAPTRAMARVFGVLESLIALSVGLGAVVTPVVMDLVGLRAALVMLGLLSPVAVSLCWLRLRALDDRMVRRDDELEALRGVALFDVLPLPALEDVARQLDHVIVPAGATVFSQGEEGDRFYVVMDGEAEVIGDGRRVAGLGPGDSFGEIALLRRVPRTATVRAVTPLRLESLRCDRFLAVLTRTRGDAAAHARADEMLDRFAPGPEPEPEVS
jgi:MFS family permease